ncbi:MAG: hypothetical protein LUD53_03215 [Clostridiales bacterium]|nr:hypothetical protein [Clostridiales bacterium]
MAVNELIKDCGLEVIHTGDADAVITEPYCCDLLSVAMGNTPAGCAWCTVMANMNTLAVASLADCACIILCCSANADDNMKLKAVSQDLTLLRTDRPIFDMALEVYNQIHG